MMASSKYSSFVNFLLFGILLQKVILISAESNCLNPTFGETQKIVLNYFFNSDVKGLSEVLCSILLDSNGLISVVFHMCSDLKDKDICVQRDSCIFNRLFACYYKYYAKQYNNYCTEVLPSLDPELADCICQGSADDILAKNESARINYGIKTLPALVIGENYDPCFTDYSYAGMKTYLCKAYKNKLPLCTS